MLWFWWIYSGLAGVLMLFFALDTWFGMSRIARLDRPEWDAAPASGPRVSVVVPARNEEAGVRACLESLLAQDYQELEVIAVNDRSTDATGAIMDELARGDARLHVVHVSELPPDWLGKPHAMWQGAQAASGEWLLFTDGDVIFRGDCIRRAVAYAEQDRADHLVLFPSFIIKSFGERLALAVFQLGTVGIRPWKVPDPKSRAHIGAGAFNMITRTAYEKVGTFAALRLEIVEDLKLGKLVKQAGLPSRAALGPGMVRLHWVDGMFGIVRALTKNLYAFVDFRWYLALGLALVLAALHVGPFVFVWLAPGWAKLGFAIWLAGLFSFYVRLRPAIGISPWFFFLHPVGSSLILAAVVRSALVTIRDGGVTWRDTFYPVGMLRKS